MSNDRQNRAAGTEVSTIFVDRGLRVTRYTPSVLALFRLSPTDIGRPLAEIPHLLDYDQLSVDVASVLSTRTTIEREVPRHDGRWYLACLLPSHAAEGTLDGVSLIFVDMHEWKVAAEARARLLAEHQQQRSFLERLITTVPVAIAVLHGPEHRFVLSNPEYDRLARDKGALLGHTVAEIWPELAAQIIPLLDHVYQTGERYQATHIPLLIERNGITSEELFTFTYERLEDASGMPEGVLVIAYEVTEYVQMQRQAEAAALERQLVEERKVLLQMLVAAQEEERRRLARELHDQFGQQLSALRFGLAALADPAHTDRAATFARLQQIAAQLDQDVSRLALELRPSVLDDMGLHVALEQHVEEWSATYRISAEFQATGLEHAPIPSEIEIVIYRVVQEALTNVLKHADARHVSIILEQHADKVRAILEDDGRGFDPEAVLHVSNLQRRLGLLGMRERVALVGGTLVIESAPGYGTTLFVQIPTPRSEGHT